MSQWHNQSGRPLSALPWLEAHHQAKLAERTIFAKSILKKAPQRIVDLGCGPGIWLNLFNQLAALDCEFIGLDTDNDALKIAQSRSSQWSRKVSFQQFDIQNANNLPRADIYLAFNIFPYIKNANQFLEGLRKKMGGEGTLIVRQYDGALLRFGPIDHRCRQKIDNSLYSALATSEQFHHYDLDRTFAALTASNFANKEIDFDVFKRVAPYSTDFIGYLENTVNWTASYIGIDASDRLLNWYQQQSATNFIAPSYFTEVDLVAWLS